jgi:hypothetical protein
MQYCNGAFHAGQPLAVSVGIGDILTAATRILRKIQLSLDTLLDENTMGEDLYVRHQNDCRRRGIKPPTGGRPLPDADVFREGLPARDAPLTESGTDILAGVIRIRHPDSIRHQDRLRGPRPAPETSQEIMTAVANRTPDNVQFPVVAGCRYGVVPKSEYLNKTWLVHCANAQNMGMEMGQGIRILVPIQQQRQHRGRVPGWKKT